MTNYCRCDPSISDLHVYYNYVDEFELREPRYAFDSKGKLWTDPQWKILPTRLCNFLAHFTELVPRRDMRQNFLVEDLLEHYDDGVLLFGFGHVHISIAPVTLCFGSRKRAAAALGVNRLLHADYMAASQNVRSGSCSGPTCVPDPRSRPPIQTPLEETIQTL